MKFMELVDYEPDKSSLNFGSDTKSVVSAAILPLHAGLRVERGHFTRLRLYWYNGEY